MTSSLLNMPHYWENKHQFWILNFVCPCSWKFLNLCAIWIEHVLLLIHNCYSMSNYEFPHQVSDLLSLHIIFTYKSIITYFGWWNVTCHSLIVLFLKLTSYHITSYNTGPCFSMEERWYHAIYIWYGKILMFMKQYCTSYTNIRYHIDMFTKSPKFAGLGLGKTGRLSHYKGGHRSLKNWNHRWITWRSVYVHLILQKIIPLLYNMQNSHRHSNIQECMHGLPVLLILVIQWLYLLLVFRWVGEVFKWAYGAMFS